MRRVRAIFRPLLPLHVGDDEGPEGPGDAPVLAPPPGDVLAGGQVPN